MTRKLFAIAVCLTGILNLHAQGTVEDYNRAYALRSKYNPSRVTHSNVQPQWIPETDCFWYVQHTEGKDEYIRVDAARNKRTPLLNTSRVADALSQQSGKEVKANYLPWQNIRVTGKGNCLTFDFDGRKWEYDVKHNRLTEKERIHKNGPGRHWMERDDERNGHPVESPDHRYTAYIKNDNVYIKEKATGREQALSIDGTAGNYYSAYLQWSPDSRKVLACRIRPSEKRYVYYVESSPRDQLQPKLHKQEYAKPGDELPFKVPCIFDVEKGTRLIPSTELFCRQYAIEWLRWDADSRAVTFEYNERGHKTYRLLELSAEDGSVRTLIEEKEEKYVNYPRLYRHHLSDGRRILWTSERDNFNHIYLYDRNRLDTPRQVTQGAWYVREIVHVDEEREQIYFSANGVNPTEDPYLIHYYRINFDGSGFTSLTPEEGTHKVWFSPDFRYLVDVYSTVSCPPTAVLRDATDGKIRMTLETADISALTTEGWKAPEVFQAPGRDGITPMWGIIYRPSNFDPSHSYPVIEYIYSGPGDQYVPKLFSAYNWWMTSLAELGFIVVQVDGMTTSFRSKAFEEVCYKNLKDAGLPDHMAWIRAAAERYPYMDINRVGIFGCSAGGQESTAAVLQYPDFYKAAYSACGCHDNRMDKIWWNELWMGYPVDESYAASSNVEMAHLLQRPLMLVVGEMDDNVDPASTMQVADALIRANKDFELVVIPGARHTMGEDYGEHKRYDFFVRHLLGVNPPAWSEVKTK
ncbi:MAG: S9 family peptidase [Clostridium sp.]|nr:S9 family peptidase [Clostridium sp.]